MPPERIPDKVKSQMNDHEQYLLNNHESIINQLLEDPFKYLIGDEVLNRPTLPLAPTQDDNEIENNILVGAKFATQEPLNAFYANSSYEFGLPKEITSDLDNNLPNLSNIIHGKLNHQFDDYNEYLSQSRLQKGNKTQHDNYKTYDDSIAHFILFKTYNLDQSQFAILTQLEAEDFDDTEFLRQILQATLDNGYDLSTDFIKTLNDKLFDTNNEAVEDEELIEQALQATYGSETDHTNSSTEAESQALSVTTNPYFSFSHKSQEGIAPDDSTAPDPTQPRNRTP